jgi:CheY-like chemotaxis protein
MNGHIWVKNCDEGGGAIFSFCFPRGDESFCEEESSHGDSMHLRALELSKDDAKTFRALVVDDSMINLKVLERMLVRLGVQEVTTCSDGSKALEYIESIQQLHDLPNLLLSDLNMPNINGDELIRRMREMEKYEALPLKAMACSADWTQETEERCFEAGFDGVLRKPIMFSGLRDFLAQTAASE